jgi:hypothetical protein
MGWTNGRYLNGARERVALIGRRAKDAASWDAAPACPKQSAGAVSPADLWWTGL